MLTPEGFKLNNRGRKPTVIQIVPLRGTIYIVIKRISSNTTLTFIYLYNFFKLTFNNIFNNY